MKKTLRPLDDEFQLWKNIYWTNRNDILKIEYEEIYDKREDIPSAYITAFDIKGAIETNISH